MFKDYFDSLIKIFCMALFEKITFCLLHKVFTKGKMSLVLRRAEKGKKTVSTPLIKNSFLVTYNDAIKLKILPGLPESSIEL